MRATAVTDPQGGRLPGVLIGLGRSVKKSVENSLAGTVRIAKERTPCRYRI